MKIILFKKRKINYTTFKKIMLYWKYSSTRIFFINEYWILIPSAVLANYLIIRNLRLKRAKMKELKRLIDQIEREKNQKNLIIQSWFKRKWVYTAFNSRWVDRFFRFSRYRLHCISL